MSVEKVPELSPLLEGIPTPPTALIAQARDLRPAGQARRRRRRLTFGGLGAALLIAIGLSPVGSAAAGFIGELTGFGEEPTLPQPRTVAGSARVVDRGALADGSRWEVVTKDVKGMGPSLCFSVTWLDAGPQDIDSYCTNSSSTGQGSNAPLSGGIAFPPGSKGGPGLMFGFADSPEVADVETIATTASSSTPLETEVIRVVGEPLEAAGGSFPVTIYLGELSAGELSQAARGEQNIIVSARDQDGNELDRHVVLVPDLKPEVSEQLGIEVFHELPRALERIEGLDAVPLSTEQRDELISPGYDGAKLGDAVDLFTATPEVKAEKRRNAELLGDRQGIPRPLPWIKAGAIELPSGDIAYFVLSAPLQGGPGHVGIYDAHDLSVIRFEERPGG